MLVDIIKVIFTFLCGGGIASLISVIITGKKTNSDIEKTSTEEWQSLYAEMKQELHKQKEENEALRAEIENLKTRMLELATDLANYKQSEQYIKELEKYTNHLLHTLKTIAGHDAYEEALKKRPQRNDGISL